MNCDAVEIGAAQAAEITNEDRIVAGKIDLNTGLLLRTFDGVRNSTKLVRFLGAKGPSAVSELLRIPREPASRDTRV